LLYAGIPRREGVGPRGQECPRHTGLSFVIVLSYVLGVLGMKRFALLLCASVFLCINCPAQDSDEGIHAPDGGTFERITSILIPPVLHAPFSSTVTAEWTKVLEDGSTLTVQNHRVVVRDGAGRIYQERRRLVPKDLQQEPDLMRIEISDPSTHTKYFCQAATHICALEDYAGPESASAQPLGVQEDSLGTLMREDLGKNIVSGLDATGTRETRTLNPGTIGNDRPISIVKEYWYSPQLGINLLVKRVDPRHGTEIFNVTDISLVEPDPKLFAVPAGFTVVDRRAKSGGTAQGSVRSYEIPAGVYRVGGGVTAPKLIYGPNPQYSEEARKAKYQGTVVLWMIVDAQGQPHDIRVARSIGKGLDEEAVKAVRRWRFEPARFNGQPVSVQINTEVSFKLY
jgi:TonB family protein